MADLINVGLQKNIRTELQGFIIDDIANINKCIESYTDFPGGKPVIISDSVYKARRPSRNLRDFPAITIFSDNKDTKWIASRTTDDTSTCTIFCCILYTETEYLDDLVEDFSESVAAVLLKHPKFDFTITENNESVTYGVYDALPTNIKYGSLDSGFIRAGQITWTSHLYLHQSQSY
jgi:hypothetical protein